MIRPLAGVRVAILAASGFCERNMTQSQRALQEAGAHICIVSSEQGLINGWTGESWGHHYAVDGTLNTALGADYEILVIPGGRRSHDKLQLTAHTNRFIKSFMTASKPVAVFDETEGIIPDESDNLYKGSVEGMIEFFVSRLIMDQAA